MWVWGMRYKWVGSGVRPVFVNSGEQYFSLMQVVENNILIICKYYIQIPEYIPALEMSPGICVTSWSSLSQRYEMLFGYPSARHCSFTLEPSDMVVFLGGTIMYAFPTTVYIWLHNEKSTAVNVPSSGGRINIFGIWASSRLPQHADLMIESLIGFV